MVERVDTAVVVVGAGGNTVGTVVAGVELVVTDGVGDFGNDAMGGLEILVDTVGFVTFDEDID